MRNDPNPFDKKEPEVNPLSGSKRKKQRLAKWEADLNMREMDSKEKEKELAKQEADLKMREMDSKKKEKELANREADLNRREMDSKKKEKELAKHSKKKEKELAKQEADLNMREMDSKKKEKEFAKHSKKKEKELAKREGGLNKREMLMECLMTEEKEEELKVVHSRAECPQTRNTLSVAKSLADNWIGGPPTLKSRALAVMKSEVSRHADELNYGLGTWTKSCNTVGIQTDINTEPCTSAVKHPCGGSEKLLSLWNSNEQKLGSVLVAKLNMICEADFNVLFGYLNSCYPQNDSDMDSSDQLRLEAAKVSHLYSVLTKISNESSSLEDLLEALVDLCSLENVVIIHKALRVLRTTLSNSLTMEMEFGRSDNVIVEENRKANINVHTNSENESLPFANVAEMLKQGQIPFGLKPSDVKPVPSSNRFLNNQFTARISGAYWVSLFENMCKFVIRNNDTKTREEAVSIMNQILMRQKALERDKFVGELVFQSLSQLLRKESGFSVQDQAVHTLYLLCNCPKAIAILDSAFKENGDRTCSNIMNEKSILTFQGLNEILIGLADCVAYCGSATIEEMKLRRNAIQFLAFFVSSAVNGAQILLYHKLSKETNFIAIIVRSLSSDLDLHQSNSAQQSSFLREQSLLFREALLLLEGLVADSRWPEHLFSVLTYTRDLATTTLDVADRLTRKSNLLWQVESEDLARFFKKKFSSYLASLKV